MNVRNTIMASIAVLFACHAGAAFADDYPNRVVKFVVPYEAGAGNDLATRYLAEQLTEMLHQPFVVENRPGISGISGSEFVSAEKPDGYYLLEAADTETSAPFLLPNVTLDPTRDLTPITEIGFTPFVLVVNPSVPAKTPRELIDFIKQNPDKFRWGLGGIGTPGHLAVEKIDRATGIDPQKIPYKGNAPAVTAVLSGEVSGMLASPTAVQAMVQSGTLRALAVLTLQPIPTMPDVPTLASAGFPGLQAGSWLGIWGPKGMPPALVTQIQKDIALAMADPNLKKKFAASGILPDVSNSPQDFAKYVQSEMQSNHELIDKLNIHLTQ